MQITLTKELFKIVNSCDAKTWTQLPLSLAVHIKSIISLSSGSRSDYIKMKSPLHQSTVYHIVSF